MAIEIVGPYMPKQGRIVWSSVHCPGTNLDKKVNSVPSNIHVTTTILGQGATKGRRVQENMEKESRRQSGQLSAYECSRWQKRGKIYYSNTLILIRELSISHKTFSSGYHWGSDDQTRDWRRPWGWNGRKLGPGKNWEIDTQPVTKIQYTLEYGALYFTVMSFSNRTKFYLAYAWLMILRWS